MEVECDIFLGGTAKKNPWRRKAKKILVALGVNPKRIFDPVVPEGTWNKEHQPREDRAKKACRFVLIYIGLPDPSNPDRVSPYSLIEAALGLMDNEDQTVIVFDLKGLSEEIRRSMEKGMQDLQKRFPRAAIFDSLNQGCRWLARQVRR